MRSCVKSLGLWRVILSNQIQQQSKPRALRCRERNAGLLQTEQPIAIGMQTQDGRVDATRGQAELSSHFVCVASIPGAGNINTQALRGHEEPLWIQLAA